LTINELLHIISQGENEQTEFKQSFNRQTIETLVAFANNKGGTIVIGMSDSGAITGTEITPESIQNWQNEIKLKTQPALRICKKITYPFWLVLLPFFYVSNFAKRRKLLATICALKKNKITTPILYTLFLYNSLIRI